MPALPQVENALADSSYPWELVRFLGSAKVAKAIQKTRAPMVAEYTLNRLRSSPGGTHAYVLKQSAAQKLVHIITQEIFCPIDALIGMPWLTQIENLVVQPAIVQHNEDIPSQIGQARFSKAVTSDLVFWAHKIIRPIYKAQYAWLKQREFNRTGCTRTAF